jgi:uncharacterized protein
MPPMRTAAGATLTLFLLTRAVAQPAFPAQTGYINDETRVVSAGTRDQLEELLETVEKETGAEIAIAAVDSLGGRSIGDYAKALFAHWTIGEGKHNAGVLVVAVPQQRTVHVEVAHLLSLLLPRDDIDRIVRDHFMPAFRGGDFDTGIRQGMTQLAEAMRTAVGIEPVEGPPGKSTGVGDPVEAEDAAPAAAADTATTEVPAAYADWVTVAFFGLFVSVGFFIAGAGLGARLPAVVLFGSVFGGFPFLLTLLMPSAAPFYVLGSLALAMAAVGVRHGLRGGELVKGFRNVRRRPR